MGWFTVCQRPLMCCGVIWRCCLCIGRYSCATFGLVSVEMECVVVVVVIVDVVVVKMNSRARDSRGFTSADHSRVNYLS